MSLIKSYKSYLSPNTRKNSFLENTISFLRNGAAYMFDLQMSLFGGITSNMIEVESEENEQDFDKSLFCATVWFRSTPKTKKNRPILPPLMIQRFKQYFGDDPSQATLRYLTAQVGENNEWVDCRQKYKLLCDQLKACIDDDVRCLITAGFLPVQKGDNSQPWAAMSKLFGTGEKEDSEIKITICKQIGLELQKKPSTYAKLRRVILGVANASSTQDFSRVFKANGGGADNILVQLLKTMDQQDKDLSGNQLIWKNKSIDVADMIKKINGYCDKLIDAKSKDIQFKHNRKIEALIARNIGHEFHQNSWSEMWKNAMADLQSKNSRNYSFAQDQLQLEKEMESYSDGVKNFELLNGFFKSRYFGGAEGFLILPHHLGDITDLKALFETWKKSEVEIDEIIEGHCEEIRQSLKKEPMANLLRYVYDIQDKIVCGNESPALSLYNAARFNLAKHKLMSHKVHPSVKGNLAFTWSDQSALNGRIISPDKVKRSNRPDSLDCRIWTEIELLDGNRWVKHHIPFYDARFFEEVYASGVKASDLNFRAQRFGHTPNKTLDDDAIACLRKMPKKHRKVAKRIARIQHAIANGTLPKVNWKNCAINLNQDERGFSIVVARKFEVEYETREKHEMIKENDVICSFDMNQTAPSTYAIHTVVSKKEIGAIPFRNIHVKLLETGSIQSATQSTSAQFDQLSYSGLSHNSYKDWRQHAKTFIGKWRTIFVKNTRKGEIEKRDVMEEFEKVESYQPSLYHFNARYAAMIRKIIKGKSKTDLKEIRKEILRFLDDKGASIRNVSSLNHDSFEAIRKSKSCINAYFSVGLNAQIGQEITDEEKEKFDPEMFSLRRSLEKHRVNKGKEKINRIANVIVSIAIRNKGSIHMEGQLPVGTKKHKKSQNNRNTDWLSRGVCNKVAQLAKMHGIRFSTVSPHSTSHQDPFEHNNDYDNPIGKMNCRLEQVVIKDISIHDMNRLSRYLKGGTGGQSTTTEYYNRGMQNFLAHYGLREVEDFLKKKTEEGDLVKLRQFRKILSDKLGGSDKKIIMPKKGGRYYLATHKVTTIGTWIDYNGAKKWLCNADEVAALNVGLTIHSTKSTARDKVVKSKKRSKTV